MTSPLGKNYCLINVDKKKKQQQQQQQQQLKYSTVFYN